MPIDDLYYSNKRDAHGKKIPTAIGREGRKARYRVRWIDPYTGETRTQACRTRPEATRTDAQIQAAIAAGRYVDPQAGTITVQQYAEQWRVTKMHRDSTEGSVERYLRLHIYPLLGDIPIARLLPSHLRKWIKERAQHLKPSSLRVIFGTLESMLDDAVRDKVIGTNPARDVKKQLPRTVWERKFVPSANQVHALAAALPARYRAMVYLAAGCGWRFGEIAGLEPEAIEFLPRTISVRQQLKWVSPRPPYIGAPKSRSSARTSEMPEMTSLALAAHLEEFGATEVAVDDETAGAVVTRAARLVFTTTAGKPVTSDEFSRVWRKAVATVPGLPQDGTFTLHSLRHYYATLLIHAGASVKTVQLALGHSSPRVTLQTYVHEWPDSDGRTRSLVEQMLGTAPEQTPGQDDREQGPDEGPAATPVAS